MSIEDNMILNIIEATLVVDKLEINDLESDNVEQKTVEVVASKFVGSVIPYVVINQYEFTIDHLISFELNNDSFLPTLRLTIIDTNGLFMGRHFPKDGDVISFYIKSNNEEIFKPIRIDFDILKIQPFMKTGSSIVNRFTFYGQMKIPKLLTEFCEAYPELSSFDTLLEVSQKLELGYSSNIDTTNDIMNWINPNDTTLKFIKDITNHSYLDENSFLTTFIDPYYNLNFVEVNRLFSVEAEVLESETYLANAADTKPGIESNDTIIKSPLLLTNNTQFRGSSKYISSYKMFNNSGKIFLKNGYKRYGQFFDMNEDLYVSEFVDPLTTEGSDSLIHTKGRYVGEAGTMEPEGIIDEHFKYKYLGKTEYGEDANVYDNYLFSDVINYQNNMEINKVGMIVDLDIADLTLVRYQTIPIIIVEYDPNAVEMTQESNVGTDSEETTINRFLSGNYVISGISYNYSQKGLIKQSLVLLKREFDIPY
jgi:hypothetical protein